MIELMAAAVTPCGTYAEQSIQVSEPYESISPDCRWMIRPDPKHGLSLFNIRTGQRLDSFVMDRSAAIHWLRDNETLVINYFEGSGTTRPLLLKLNPGERNRFIDLHPLLWESVSRKLPVPARQMYHYYATYIRDGGDHLTIAANVHYTLKGNDGPGGSSCFIYRVSKHVPVTYRLLSAYRETEARPCPTGTQKDD